MWVGGVLVGGGGRGEREAETCTTWKSQKTLVTQMKFIFAFIRESH